MSNPRTGTPARQAAHQLPPPRARLIQQSDSSSSPARRSAGRIRTDPLRLLPRLTVRDRLIIETLGEHQVLTTHQLGALAFGSAAGARVRLVALYRMGVLDRFRWQIPNGSEPWHYTLGVAGAALLAAIDARPAPRPAELRRRITHLATSPRLSHLLGVNGFFTALAGRARTHPDAALEVWLSENRCAERWGRIVRPDGYGVWAEHGRQVDFFLEYDTGSEPLTRVLAKLPGYADLATAGGPAGPVLFWLPSTAREANLHRLLAAHASRVPVATATEEWASAVGADPAGPTWLTTPGAARRRLIDLPAASATHGGERHC